ncbi:transcriptional regulator [Halobacteriales archaeon QS_1_68_20]|nr:MAG: transcriptional regulator [Halobacteriales archaeon QS_1_68_20]
MAYELDDVDRGILHALQQDARNATIEEMADRVGVSPSTVRDRIGDMEDAGVIEGYHPQVNYGAAGFDLHVLYLCRAPTGDRGDLAERVLDISGVVEILEVLDSEQNVFVEAVETDSDHMAATHDALVDAGLDVIQTEHVRRTFRQPFDHFGADVTDE